MYQESIFKEEPGSKGANAILKLEGGREPIYVASPDTDSPNVIALAELLFWTQQFKEHGEDIAYRLEQASMAEDREQGIMFKGIFDLLHERAMQTELENDALNELSDVVVKKTEELIQFKRRLQRMQENAEMFSFLAPSYVDHLAREAQHVVDHQKKLIEGNVSTNRDEVVTFWAYIMSQHGAYITQWLDSHEESLFNAALEGKKEFAHIEKEHGLEGDVDPLPERLDQIIDIGRQLVRGVETATIKSAGYPEMFDHLAREAVFFKYELLRADNMAHIKPKAA